MKTRAKKRIRAFTILVIALIFGVFFIFKTIVNKPLKISESEIVTVNEGDSFYSIINKLEKENKIKNSTAIKVYAKLTGLKLDVVPGKHNLQRDMSIKEIAEALRNTSNVDVVTITFPEGYDVESIAERVESEGLCTREEFIQAVKDYPLPSYIKNNPEKRYNLEGFLFPDTYKFEKEVEPQYIIEAMLSQFESVWREVTEGLDIAQDDIEKIITIASMIEKEARTQEDRPLVSSVIYNRINKQMPLQIDATVIYAHGYYIQSVLYKHLAIESKYNTYLYKGLPIGPICNPGRPSIEAALNPKSTDYLYYLLSTDKEHYFTNSYDDFLDKKKELGY